MSITDEGHYGPKQLNLLKTVWGEGFLSPGGTAEIDEVMEGIDAIGKKNLETSCKIYLSLYLNNVPLTRIIFNLSNMFQQLLWIKMGDFSKPSMGVNKIIQRNLQNYNRKYSERELKDVISGLRSLDLQVKSTSINERELMIPFLVKSCKGMYGSV